MQQSKEKIELIRPTANFNLRKISIHIDSARQQRQRYMAPLRDYLEEFHLKTQYSTVEQPNKRDQFSMKIKYQATQVKILQNSFELS